MLVDEVMALGRQTFKKVPVDFVDFRNVGTSQIKFQKLPLSRRDKRIVPKDIRYCRCLTFRLLEQASGERRSMSILRKITGNFCAMSDRVPKLLCFGKFLIK